MGPSQLFIASTPTPPNYIKIMTSYLIQVIDVLVLIMLGKDGKAMILQKPCRFAGSRCDIFTKRFYTISSAYVEFKFIYMRVLCLLNEKADKSALSTAFLF
jgi:hypothetical protein